jgi:hypothetical protein
VKGQDSLSVDEWVVGKDHCPGAVARLLKAALLRCMSPEMGHCASKQCIVEPRLAEARPKMSASATTFNCVLWFRKSEHQLSALTRESANRNVREGRRPFCLPAV